MADYHFSAFGELKFIKESLFNPWRYASKRFDPETKLINFGKRFYDPPLSRWITTDPAGFIDGMNLYGFVKNNPYRYTDPNGLFAFPLLFLPALFEISFAGVVSWISAEAIIGAVVGATIGVGLYQLDKTVNNDHHDIAINNEAVIEEVEEKTSQKKDRNKRKKHTPDQEALSDFVKESGKNGVSNSDADILIDWAMEYKFPVRDDRGKPPHWIGGEHIHLGPKHIPIKN